MKKVILFLEKVKSFLGFVDSEFDQKVVPQIQKHNLKSILIVTVAVAVILGAIGATGLQLLVTAGIVFGVAWASLNLKLEAPSEEKKEEIKEEKKE